MRFSYKRVLADDLPLPPHTDELVMYAVYVPRRITHTDNRTARQTIGFVTKMRHNWVFGTTATNNKGYAKTRRNAARQLASLMFDMPVVNPLRQRGSRSR